MNRKHPERLTLKVSTLRGLLRAVGLMEEAPPSVRNAGKRVRARQALMAASARLVTA